jgi:flagellar hook-associated protein 2
MATVGINFGAATSGQGFDVATTVSSITALTSAIETPWKNQLTSLKAQDAALTTIGTDLSTLSTAVSALTDLNGALAQKEGSSSDTSVLTLTAASAAAVAGSHTVVVSSLASTSSNFSDQVAGLSDTLSGSLSIQVGSGQSQTITIGSSNNTLNSLALAINDGSYGVIASVVSDTKGYRLSLVSKTSGADGQLTLGGSLTDTTASKTLNFLVGQTGADAQLTVDGLQTTSASNTVTGAIPGLTFQLLASSPTESIQIQVTNNNAGVGTAIQSFVTAYNTVAADIKKQEATTSSGAAEPLYGDPTLAEIQSQLSSSLFGGATSGAISNIGQLGITANSDGTLTFTQSTLDTTLNAHYADVTSFLQDKGSFGQSFSTTLNTLGNSSSTGAVALELSQNASVEKGLNDNVTKEDAIIATETKTLTTELTTANQELQAIPTQLSEVNEIYSAFTGYNQNVNG